MDETSTSLRRKGNELFNAALQPGVAPVLKRARLEQALQ